MTGLVASRTCGDCTVCCTVLPIDADGFAKSSGVTCGHCVSAGCAIHPDRPTPCRAFDCGWLQLPMLDDAWRPDRSGILIMADDDDIPARYTERPGIKLLLVGERRTSLTLPMLGYVAGLVDGGMPTFIAVPGPPGCFFAKAFLNDRLRAAVARRDGGEMLRTLHALLDILEAGDFEPVPTGPFNPG
ncbi:MAG: hypothetical protein WC068_01380 [Caulobacter sp.]